MLTFVFGSSEMREIRAYILHCCNNSPKDKKTAVKFRKSLNHPKSFTANPLNSELLLDTAEQPELRELEYLLNSEQLFSITRDIIYLPSFHIH